MSLLEDLQTLVGQRSGPRILTLDIETTRARVEVFSLFQRYIHIDRVRAPSRILCFSARWLGEDRDIFGHAWDDENDDAQLRLHQKMHALLSEADVVVTWNGNRFDLQWIEAECARLGLRRPVPYKSVDLFAIGKRKFKAGLMSLKLDWSARTWLRDSKVKHGETDLWDDIRYGSRDERRQACKKMKEYCIYDTRLTERLFIEYLPWVPVNLTLHREDTDDDLVRCVKCGSNNLRVEKKRYITSAYAYRMYTCKDCGSPSRGKRSNVTTELRVIV